MAGPSDSENTIHVSPSLIQAVARQPDELSPLQPTQYKFVLNRTPETIYFCQKANLPGFGIGTAFQETPLGVAIPRPGSKYEFEEFSVSFLVNEDMGNWLEISDWMREIVPLGSFKGILKPGQELSDGSLIILTSNHNAQVVVDFYGMFPTSLTSIEFDGTLNEPESIVGTATFAYSHYDIRKLS